MYNNIMWKRLILASLVISGIVLLYSVSKLAKEEDDTWQSLMKFNI